MSQAGIPFGDLIALYGLKVLVAIAIFFVGKWLARVITNFTKKVMKRKDIDETLINFAGNFVYAVLLAFVIIAILGQLGIQTASIIAVLGAAGLAVGFALQGSLSNFAAGILLIIFKPFTKGDLIESGGALGTVEAIGLFTTHLISLDNKTIFIPNAKVTADTITNFSAEETRRVDLVFGVGYSDDLDKAKNVLEDILANDERILKDPQPTIGVLELADSSVNIAVRPWVKTSDYWSVYFDTVKGVKQRFDAEGITIPFPQRDVHMHSQ
jgi:small conductance mechanosensitive channel